ncbi:MAG: RsbRD N-terminal domain-containing protein [Desulfobacterales bacterium]
MRLNDLLVQRKTTLVKKWFAAAIGTYPPDTAKFLKNQKDPFSNPVGRTIYNGLEGLFDELLKETDQEAMRSLLDPIIRIRAIQNFSPAQATGFIFFLKDVIRENIQKEAFETQDFNELLSFESKIDGLGMIAFNIYMSCREKIYELKANEMRNRTFRAFERAGLVREMPADTPDLDNINI